MSHTAVRGAGIRPRRVAAPSWEWDGSTGVTLKQAAPAAYRLVWLSMLLLLAGGLCTVLSVSVAEGLTGGDRYEYFRPQAIAAAIGLLLLVGISRLDYRRLRAFSMFFLGLIALFLVLVHVPQFGASEGGSASWFVLGPLNFQPSEFAKLAVIMAGAHLLSMRKVHPGDFASYMLPFGLIGLGACGLVVLEGDLGTAVIMAGLVLGLLWLAGMKGGQWLLVAGTMTAAAAGLIFSNAERMSRIFSFIDPSADPQGSSYQLWQSLMALGRGGWFGVGPGESVQKYQYLPKAHTDMIYSILGEEFGLLGAGLVLLLFGVFAMSCWRLARQCTDPMGKYLIAGCGMLVTLQAVVNIGGVIGALPLTGVPLPFISYGRSSLLAMLMAVGLILAVARRATIGPAPARAVRYDNAKYDNVTRIDRRRRDGGPRGARPGVS